MHIVARRIVFYSLVAIFVVGGFYAVATALGLTVATGGTLVRTGSLFVESNPRGANLFIDGVPVDESPRFLSGGTLIKNLAARTYEVRAEYDERTLWRAELPVSPGLVTRATDIFLWPREATSSLIATAVESFTLSAGIPVVRTAGSMLLFDGVRMVGTELEYSSDDSAALITRTGNTVYWAGSGPTDANINLTALFHSLKERDLGLPGTVPLVTVRPHPFSAGKFLITTETSFYILDTRRDFLERVVTAANITYASFNDSEVLLLGSDGTLTAVDLVFKTVSTAPFSSGTIVHLESAMNGNVLVELSEEGRLSIYERATGERTTVAEQVSEFSLGPNGNRLAYVSGNAVSVYFLDRYEGDVLVPQGTSIRIWEGSEKPRQLSWNSSLSRYLFFLSHEGLVAAEIGLNGERNHKVLASDVRSFAFTGFTAYVLKENKDLISLSFEE